MNRYGISVELKNVPVLDPEFTPLLKFNRAFLEGATKPVSIAVERADGQVATTNTFIHGTPEMAEATNEHGSLLYGFGVILNYLFDVNTLLSIAKTQMPLHIVEKKVPYIDENGNSVKPETPNAYKFETLILDMIYMMDNCLSFEVEREKEFAPVKNATGVDSVESARALLVKNNIAI